MRTLIYNPIKNIASLIIVHIYPLFLFLHLYDKFDDHLLEHNDLMHTQKICMP